VKPSVRRFEEHEWPLYRSLRLSALTDAPDAFGSTLAREAGRPHEEWARRLASGVGSRLNHPLLAELAGEPIGLAWGRIEEHDLAIANLFQMWVAPTHRRLGAGRMLLDAVIAWAKQAGAAELCLGVTLGTPALRMYTSAGFEPTSEPQPIRPESTLLGQAMRLDLRPQ
jgi:GNAT superfamily N-acetyltransferase